MSRCHNCLRSVGECARRLANHTGTCCTNCDHGGGE